MQTDVIEELTAPPAPKKLRESGAAKKARLLKVSPAAPESRVRRGKVRPSEAAERAAVQEGERA
jgi:hypothetical protein